ncbi:MAG: hypothetical protein O3C21_09885 [Verrucomicrobia bacterium]|nr:hypothetical protein [Verrucomicrobiota bacterium]
MSICAWRIRGPRTENGGDGTVWEGALDGELVIEGEVRSAAAFEEDDDETGDDVGIQVGDVGEGVFMNDL